MALGQYFLKVRQQLFLYDLLPLFLRVFGRMPTVQELKDHIPHKGVLLLEASEPLSAVELEIQGHRKDILLFLCIGKDKEYQLCLVDGKSYGAPDHRDGLRPGRSRLLGVGL